MEEEESLSPADAGIQEIIKHYYSKVLYQRLPPLRATRRQLEMDLISYVLGLVGGNVTNAADYLNLQRTTLSQMITRYKPGINYTGELE